MTDDQILVSLGANNLYRKAVDVYTEAVTNNLNLNKNLSDLFSSKKYFETNLNPSSPNANNIGLKNFLKLINDEYNTKKQNLKSYDFLKDKYDFYGIQYPSEGFFDVNYGPTNWWEKTSSHNQGFFSYVHIFKFDPEDKKFTSLDFEKTLDSKKLNTKKFTSPEKETNDVYQEVREYLITATIAKFVEENENSQLAVLLENEEVKKTYFKILQSGIKVSSDANKKTATVKIRTLFDVYGAKLALSVTDFTGLVPIPKVPSGIRKNFLVGNFLSGVDAPAQYIESLEATNEKIELTLSQLKTLKGIFKKIVKDNKLSQGSTVGFLFNEEYEYLLLVDGNNKSIGNKKLKDLLKTNKELNKTIVKLNFINCQLGGNSTGEIADFKEISFPFTTGTTTSDKDRDNQFKKMKLKTEFLGDPSLRSILKAGAPDSVSDLYDQFFNKVDIYKLAGDAKSFLASKISEKQLKRVKFQAYIESLDITEIIDCIIEPVTPYYAKQLSLKVYDSFSYFYNVAKEDNDKKFSFVMEGKGLPRPNDEGFVLETSFPYISMIPEDQKTQIFSSIVSNNPQYRNHPDLNKMGLVEVSKRPDFSPEQFIILILRRAVVNFAFALKEAEFEDFYAQLSKTNKRLNESFKSPLSALGSDHDVYKSHQKNNNKLNKKPAFGWFNNAIPTFGYNSFLSELSEAAVEAAKLTILSQIVEALKSGHDKNNEGDADNLDKTDAAIFPLIASNDPVQNIIDSANNNFNSPQDIFDHLAAALFTPPQDPEKVKCFLKSFASEVNFFTQAKLFKNPTKLNDPDVQVVREILRRCGLPADDSTIINLLLKLSELIDKDLLELKLQELNKALLEYMDICEDPNKNYEENLKKFLDDQSAKDQAANESEAAAQKLLDLLSLLDGDKIKNLAPKRYCRFGQGGKPLFDNQYSDISIDSQDKLMTTTLESINEDFNNDIAKFKPIVLKQDQKDPLAALGLNNFKSGGDISETGFGKFLKNINENNLGSTQNKNSDLPSKTTVIEDSLSFLVENSLLFEQNNFQELIDEDYESLKIYQFGFGTAFFSVIINNGNKIDQYYKSNNLPIDIPEKSISTFIYDFTTNDVIQELKVVGKPADIKMRLARMFMDIGEEYGNPLDPYPKFSKMLHSTNAPYGYNILLKILGGMGNDKSKAIAKEELDLYNLGGDNNNGDKALISAYVPKGGWKEFMKSMYQNIFSGMTARIIDQLDTFDDKKFSEIPLKDTEARNIFEENDSKRFYRDGGLVSAPEIFEDFKNLRINLQCFIDVTSTPNSYQVAKLISLYQMLFNTLIVREYLNMFFSLATKDDFFGLGSPDIEKLIASTIESEFKRQEVFSINDFQENLNQDLKDLYKYEQLTNGIATKRIFKKDPDTGETSFEATVSEGGTTVPMKDAEEFTTAVYYFVDKYYQEIKNKLQKRFGLSLNITNAPPAKDFIIPDKPLPIYSSYKDWYDIYKPGPEGKILQNTDVPIYTIDEDDTTGQKLYNGLILQNYIDIRQTFNYSPHSYLTRTWAFSEDQYNPNMLWDSQVEPPSPEDFKYEMGTDIYADYKKNYLRTQGKISFEDFQKYYSKPAETVTIASANVDASEAKDAMAHIKDNNPKTFFDKVSVGTRLCLVLDDSDDLAKSFQKLVEETLFRFNSAPMLSKSQYYNQIKLLFDEKLFTYKEGNAYAGGTKIVIPLYYREHDVLEFSEENYEKGDDWLTFMYKDVKGIFNTLNGSGDFDGIKEDLRDLVKDKINPDIFSGLIPFSIKHNLKKQYGKDLSKIFDPTIREIVGQVLMSKAAMDGDWKFSLPLSTESIFSGDNALKDGSRSEFDSNVDSGYLLLALSILPILIQAGATYSDPSWRTPWFFPGPQTPLGYLAKMFTPL